MNSARPILASATSWLEYGASPCRARGYERTSGGGRWLVADGQWPVRVHLVLERLRSLITDHYFRPGWASLRPEKRWWGQVFLLMLTVLPVPSAEAAPEAERLATRGIRSPGLTTRATHFAEKGWFRSIRLRRKAALLPCTYAAASRTQDGSLAIPCPLDFHTRSWRVGSCSSSQNVVSALSLGASSAACIQIRARITERTKERMLGVTIKSCRVRV
jgi:hypothetical protein